jgi:hypothetical protein
MRALFVWGCCLRGRAPAGGAASAPAPTKRPPRPSGPPPPSPHPSPPPPHTKQKAELRSVGSLLATRCEAYKVLYEQLVRHVGAEGRGGVVSSAPTLIFNTNTNAVDASPVTHNTNATSAEARAEALNKGIGAAGLAAAAIGAVWLLRIVLRHGGGGGRRSGSSSSSAVSRLPRGKGNREMALVSVLAACGDELRKADRNESVLQDDWRIGRLRLAWPPQPAPAGYQALRPGVCDVTGALQELYGR